MTEINKEHISLLRTTLDGKYIKIDRVIELAETVFKGYENINLRKLQVLDNLGFVQYVEAEKHLDSNCFFKQQSDILSQKAQILTELTRNTDNQEIQNLISKEIDKLEESYAELNKSDVKLLKPVSHFLEVYEKFRTANKRQKLFKKVFPVGIFLIAMIFAYLAEQLFDPINPKIIVFLSSIHIKFISPDFLKFLVSFLLGYFIIDKIKESITASYQKAVLKELVDNIELEIDNYNRQIDIFCKDRKINRVCFDSIFSKFIKQVKP